MKKYYLPMALAAVTSVSAYAQYTIPEENTALQDKSGYNMMLFKRYDFATPAIDGVEFAGSTIAWSSTENSDFLFSKNKSHQCTIEGLESFWYQINNPVWYSAKGLRNVNSGPRGFAMSGMKAGQILVVEGYTGGYNTGGTSTFYNGFCIPNAASTTPTYTNPLQVEDISEEVNTANGIVEGETYEGKPYLYLRVLNDGWVSLAIERNATISGIQVWNEYTEEETITSPTLNIASVDGSNRTWSWKAGESNLKSDITTYYSFGSTDPKTDGVALSEGDVISSANAKEDDYDGTNLTVNIVSKSAKDNFSDVVSTTFDVSPITLNAPVFSLAAVNGLTRSYTISWTANTLCGETATISYTAGSNSGTIANGGVVEATEGPITATVSVDGYTDGTATLGTLTAQGVNLGVKKSWDFENLTEKQYSAITGSEAGWTYTSGKGRSFLNLDASDATAYVADQTGILDGLTAYAKPTTYSTLGFYLSGSDNYRGIWPTVNATVIVNNVTAGDYIVYTNTGVKSVLQVAEGATTATINVTKNTYLNNIYVYSEIQSGTEKRDIEEDGLGTICLPYPFTAEGANLYAVSSIDTENSLVELTQAETGEAGVAYIFQATSAEQNFSYESVALADAPVAGTLTGVFEATAAPVGSYVLQKKSGDTDAQFYKVADGKQPTIGAYRAYLQKEASSSAALRIAWGGGTATAIQAVESLTNGKAEIYDINGRKLNALQKGINIVNGTKVLVK